MHFILNCENFIKVYFNDCYYYWNDTALEFYSLHRYLHAFIVGKSKVGDLYRGSLRSRSLQSRSTILPLFIGPYACCHITAH